MPDLQRMSSCIGRCLFLLNGNGTTVPENSTPRGVAAGIKAHAATEYSSFYSFSPKNLLSSREFSGRCRAAG